MRVVIIEDEPRAAARLQRLLGEILPGLQVQAVLESVDQGRRFFESPSDFDLIFCDIQLGDGVSFEIFDNRPPQHPVVFTTAYDNYALQAFKTNGIEYLLKPIDPDELKNAIEKFERMKLQLSDIQSLISQFVSPVKTYKSRFLVSVGDKIRAVDTTEIVCFYSQNKSSYLLTSAGRSYPLETPLDLLQESMDPDLYFRISRKYLVRIDAPSEIYQWSNSRLKLAIPGLEDHDIVVARERTKSFKNWLDR